MRIVPKNWRDFQHYKDRNPPWIRLHRKLLDDKDFQRLPVASRALAPMLWLLASESLDGVINADADDLSFRLRQSEAEIVEALKPLMDKGFFLPADDASAVLANSLRVAVPETETETEALQSQRQSAAAPPPAPKQRRKPRVPRQGNGIPDDFAISERVRIWAASKGHTQLDEHLEAFRSKCIAKGYTYASWDDAFMNAIREDWAKLRARSSQAPPAETAYQRSMRERVEQFAPGLAAKPPGTQQQNVLTEVFDVTAKRIA